MKAKLNLPILLLFLIMFLPLCIQAQQLVKAEYFFDTDPGIGKGKPITFTAADTANVNFSVNLTISGLLPGFHKVYVRFKDSGNKWSLYEGRTFNIKTTINSTPASQVVKGEYFFDTDPGIGKGKPISFTAADTASYQGSVSTVGLGKGFHQIFVRTRDNKNQWSLYENRTFYVNTVLNATPAVSLNNAEYFFDTDPGIGKGKPINFTVDDTASFTLNAPLNGLAKGFHKIFIRFKDNTNKWGLYEGRTFYIQGQNVTQTATSLVSMEYFVDADPGQGKGTAYTITPGATLEMVYAKAMTGLSLGNYKISIRVKDNLGHWSLAEGRSVTIATCRQPAPDFSMDPTACNNTAVKIKDLSTLVGAGAGYKWDIGYDGTIEYTTVGDIQHTFAKPGIYQVALWIANTGGCTYHTVKTIEIFGPQTNIAINGNTTMCFGDSAVLTTVSGYPGYLWSSGSISNKIVVKAGGSYSVTITDSHNCTSSSTPVTITVNQLPIIAFNTETSLCKGQSLAAGTGFTSYLWNNGSTGQSLAIFDTGKYKVQITDSKGCKNSKESNVTVKALPVVNLGVDKTICDKETALLDAGTGYASYLWTGGASSQTILAISTGNYTVTVTDTYSCKNSDTINVTVKVLPVITSIDKVLATSCSSSDASISVQSLQTGLLYSIDGGVSYQTGKTFSGLTAGNYSVYVKGSNTCFLGNLVNLPSASGILSPPVVSNTDICYGQSKTFVGNSSNIEWYDASYKYLSKGITYVPTDNKAGVYTYYAATIDGNCRSDKLTLIFAIYELPVATFSTGSEANKCRYDTLSANLQTTASIFEWSPSAGLTSSTIKNPRIFVQESTNYQVTVSNSNGCSSKVPLKITVLNTPAKPKILGQETACLNEYVIYSVNSGNKEGVNWIVNGGVKQILTKDSISIFWNDLKPSGILSVYLYNTDNGCNSTADFLPLTSAGTAALKMDIKVKGKYLLYVMDEGKYQWYNDNKILTGKTEKWLQADVKSTKNYNCLVIKDNVCKTMSNPYHFTSTKSEESTEIKLYPNPAITGFTLNISTSVNEKEGLLKIMKPNGEVLYRFTTIAHEPEKWIDLQKLGEGIYLWQYQSDDYVATGKFIKTD